MRSWLATLRRLRVERGISQEQLAADAGSIGFYLGGLERQEENPTVDLLDRLASSLRVPPAAFFIELATSEPLPKPLPGGRRKGPYAS